MSEKRVTSEDVAKLAGVSRSVVSAVLNGTKGIRLSDETRRSVLQAIEELNYHVDARARGMKTGKSGCIAAFGDMNSPLFLQLLEGMQRACAARGCHILLPGQVSGENSRFELLTLHKQRQIDGLLTLDPVSYRDERWAEAVLQAKVPYVSVEGYAEDERIPSVQADYGKSISDALNYLARHAGLAAPVYLEVHQKDSRNNWAERSRRESYQAWCVRRGMRPVIHSLPAEDRQGLTELLHRYRHGNAPMPPFLLNWAHCASLIYQIAWDMGVRIGCDLLLMTADNTFRSNRHMVPALSCMEIPYAAMGEAAVASLAEQIGTGVVSKRRITCLATLSPGDSA